MKRSGHAVSSHNGFILSGGSRGGGDEGPPNFFFDFFFFLQLAFTERVVPATQTFDWSIDDRC